MKVAWLGSYHRDAERNRILIGGLRAAGVEVLELSLPLPWLRFRSAGAVPGQLLRAVATAPLHLARFARAARRAADADAVVVGYIGHHDVAIARLLDRLGGVLRGSPLVFDPYYSLWDTVVVDRGLVDPEGLRARLLRRLEGWLLRRADLVLADTAAHAALYAELSGLPRERFAVVPVGADESLFAPAAPPADEVPESPPEVLFYGTYIPLHGVETILGAAERLRGTGARFRLVGEGQTRDAADRLVAERRLANVALEGSIAREELPRAIARAAVVLGVFGDTPKAARVVPNKVFQALACGRAVVTRESPAIDELLEPGTEVATCRAADPEALATTLGGLLADRARRTALAEAGRRRFARDYATAPLGRRLAAEIAGVVATAGSTRRSRLRPR